MQRCRLNLRGARFHIKIEDKKGNNKYKAFLFGEDREDSMKVRERESLGESEVRENSRCATNATPPRHAKEKAELV